MGRVNLKGFFLGLVAIAMLASCGDSSESGVAKVQVYMVDAPADYDSVLVDIQDVQVNASQSAVNGWESLTGATLGIYDLIGLTNGNEAFLGETELPAGNLSQVRLILGSNNELVMDGNRTALTVPSGAETGLKLNVNARINAGVTYKLIIDFDAGRSVVKAGSSGAYNLKPVLRAEFEAQTGAIEGVVSPADVPSIVYAVQGDDSVSSYPNEDGEYLIRALEEGIYDVVAVPSSETGLSTLTVEGVTVVIGEVTSVDSLKFE